MKDMRATAFLAVLALCGGGVQGQQGTAPMLARSGSVALKVTDYTAARQQVCEVASQQGAILLDAKTTVNAKGRKHGWMRFRVTQSRLSLLLPAVEAVGRLSSEDMETSDNQSDYEALARRVTRLRQHEQRLDGVLQSPRRMRGSDILYLQERLFRASVDESLLTQQRVDFERQSASSSLVVSLFEPGSLPPPAAEAWSLPTRYSSAVTQAHNLWGSQAARVATATAYAVVFAPLWAPAMVIAILLLVWLWRRRRQLAAGLTASLGGLLARSVTVISWLKRRWDARHEPAGLAHHPTPMQTEGESPWRQDAPPH